MAFSNKLGVADAPLANSLYVQRQEVPDESGPLPFPIFWIDNLGEFMVTNDGDNIIFSDT